MDGLYIKQNKFLKENWYFLLCFLVFSILFYLHVGTLFDHTLNHDYPYTFFAADQFSQHAATEGVLLLGHYRYIEPWQNYGNEKTLPHYSPGVVHLAALTSLITGIASYNAIMLIFGIVFLMLGFVFLEGLNLSKRIKTMSLVFFPLLITFNFVIGHIWGQYGSILGTFFLFLFFFCLQDERFRKPVYLGFSLTFLVFGHFPELVFALLYFAIYLVYEFIKDRDFEFIRKNEYKGLFKKYKIYLYAAVIFLIISSYYLVIFYYGNALNTGKLDSGAWSYAPIKPSEFTGFRVPTASSFGYLLYAIAIGAIITIFYKDIGKLALLFLVFATNLNLYPFFPEAAFRGFQQRFYWPITLAPFFAIFFYFLIDKIKDLKKNVNIISAIVFVIVFGMSISHYDEIKGPGVISEDQYNAMLFMEENIDDAYKISFLYGDGYDQSVINFKKLDYRIPTDFMAESVQNGKLDQNKLFEARPHASATNAVFREGKIISIAPTNPKNYTICDFNYYVLDKFSRYNSPLILFNKLFVESIDSDKFEGVYQNDQVLIIRKKGDGQCLKN